MKSHPIGQLAIVAVACLVAATSSAAVFQYAVPVETPKGPREAFLWIPPKAQRVRGVVLGGMTLAEREIAKDPIIRRLVRMNNWRSSSSSVDSPVRTLTA